MTTPDSSRSPRYLIWGSIVLLAILHQDFWWWGSTQLVLGWLPISLAFHIGLSLAAAGVWMLAIHYCWPRLEEDEPGEASREQA